MDKIIYILYTKVGDQWQLVKPFDYPFIDLQVAKACLTIVSQRDRFECKIVRYDLTDIISK